MSNVISTLFEAIDKGKEGLNIGLDIGLPKVKKITNGVIRQVFTIIAGGTGSGKTTLALYSNVYRVIKDNLGDMRYRVIFFSFEMTAEILLAKILSMYIWEEYKREVGYKEIMSREEKISDELYDLLVQCKPWLEAFMKQLTIFDSSIGADAMYAVLKKYAANHGEETHGPNNKIIYKPHIENELVQIVVDHLGLIKFTNRSKKEEMDLASNYLLTIRNIYAYSPLVLMQLNRTSSSMDRRNGGMHEIELSDIKDTSTTSEAAEVIIAIFNPWREKLPKSRGYNIQILQDKYRGIQILKNRMGEADKSVSVNFFGSVGLFREFDIKGDEMNRLSEMDMRKYIELMPGENWIPPEPGEKPKMVFRF